MRISDWSSDVCSSDLVTAINDRNTLRDCLIPLLVPERFLAGPSVNGDDLTLRPLSNLLFVLLRQHQVIPASMTKWFKSQLTLGHYLIGNDRAVVMEMLVDRIIRWLTHCSLPNTSIRSEEHTSELQSLMRISYAVFCLKKKI